jgi:hypothetical protein
MRPHTTRAALAAALIAVTSGLILAACEEAPLAPDSLQAARGTTSSLVAPSSATADPVSEVSIRVGWQDNSGNEEGFEVHRSSTGPDGTFSIRATTSADATTYLDGGLTPGAEYCYKVRAFRVAGRKRQYSALSDAACAITPNLPTPSGTEAKPAFSTAVDVTWVDNSSSEGGFRVERSLDQGTSWSLAGTVAANLTAFRDWGRASELEVCYRVRAFIGDGSSPASNVDCTVPPAAPGNLSATTSGPGIDLAWNDNSSAEDGYELVRVGTGPIADLPANTVSYRDTGMPTDVEVWYYVRAKRDGGFSDASNAASAVVVTSPPGAPSGLDARPINSTTVGMSWTDGSGLRDGYRFERSLDGGSSWADAGTVLVSDLPGYNWFADGGRTGDEDVCYRAFAFNSLGESPPSNADCATPPMGPSNIAVTQIDAATLQITWSDNSAVEIGYEVWIYTWGCGGYYYYYGCGWIGSVLAGLPANAESFTTAYQSGVYYTVVATKDGGYSDFSDWWYVP